MLPSAPSRIIKHPKKHRDSKSLFGEKKQRSHFDVLGKKKQNAARTTGKEEQFNKRRTTLWQEYWGQKKDNIYIDESGNQKLSNQSNLYNNTKHPNSFNDMDRKRKRQNDELNPHDLKRVRRTGLASVTFEDNKQNKLQQILARDKEAKRSNYIQKLEAEDELEKADSIFEQQRSHFFSQKSIVKPDPVESSKNDAYDRLVRDLVEDSRAIPARIKNFTSTELQIAREKFKEEEDTRLKKFEEGEEYSSEENEEFRDDEEKLNDLDDYIEFEGEGEFNAESEGEFFGEDAFSEFSNDTQMLIEKLRSLEDDVESFGENESFGEENFGEDESFGDNDFKEVFQNGESTGEEIYEDDNQELGVQNDSDEDTPSNKSIVNNATNEKNDKKSNNDLISSIEENNNENLEDTSDDEFQEPEDSSSEENNKDEIALMYLHNESKPNIDENDSNEEDEMESEGELDITESDIQMTDNIDKNELENEESFESDNSILNNSSHGANTNDFEEITDLQQDTEDTTLNNELIQLYFLNGKNKLLKNLEEICTSSSYPGIQNLPRKIIELLRKVSLEKKPDTSLINSIINLIKLYGSYNPKKVIKAFKDDLQIMYGKTEPSSGYPSQDDLIICKAILSLFPTDNSQNLTQLLLLYFCKNLSECYVITHQDLLSAIFICDLCLNYYQGFLPEVTNFLFNITSLINNNFKKKSKSLDTSDISENGIDLNIPAFHPRIPALKTFRRDWIFVSKKEGKSFRDDVISEISLSKNLLEHKDEGNVKWKISVQLTLVTLLKLSIQNLKSLPSFPEIFEPLLKLLSQLKVNNKFVLKQFRELASELQNLIDITKKNRTPLAYLRTSLKPFVDYEPKFQEDGFRGQYTGTESEQKEKILKSKVKRMKRQAVRELRNDNEFLRHVRNVEQSRKDYDAKLKYKEVINHLERERAEPIQYDFSIADREKKIADIRKNQKKTKNNRHQKM